MQVLKTSDYKSRLEQKLCFSKDTPEPIFDLSDCNLEKLPVSFAFIKVLQKKILILKQNQLKSLATGGELSQLSDLELLDISYNRFKVLPTEISALKNLKVYTFCRSIFIHLLSIIKKKSISRNFLYHTITWIRCPTCWTVCNNYNY